MKLDEHDVKCFLEAAERGSEYAGAELARMYTEGRGVEKNDELAAQWCLKAAEQGHEKSLCGPIVSD